MFNNFNSFNIQILVKKKILDIKKDKILIIIKEFYNKNSKFYFIIIKY